MIKFDIRMSRWPFPVALALALGQVTGVSEALISLQY